MTNTVKKEQKNRRLKSESENRSVIRAMDCMAAMPGLLICIIPGVMLLLDLIVDDMRVKQYEIYPSLFRVLNAAAVICGVIYIVYSLHRKDVDAGMLRRPSCIFFAAFMICIIISTCVNGLTTDAIHGVSFRNIGIFLTFEMIVVYMIVSSRIRLQEAKCAMLIIYTASADLIGMATLWDAFTGSISAFHEKKDLSAIFFNGNHYGYFLVMAVLISTGLYLYGEKRNLTIFGAISAALNLFMLVVNGSLGCILAALVVIIAALIATSLKKDAGTGKGGSGSVRSSRLRARIALVLIIVLVIAAFIIIPDLKSELSSLTSGAAGLLGGDLDDSAGHNRGLLWQVTMKYIAERPLTGFGCEGIWMRMYNEIQRSDPHNEILTYAVYYGVPGAVFYTLGIISALISRLRTVVSLRACEKAAFLAASGYFISSLFGVAMFYTAPFFFLFLGLSAEGCPKT